MFKSSRISIECHFIFFRVFHWWRLHSISGQPVPVFSCFHSKMFPYVQMEFLVFWFVPIASCLVTELPWKELGFILFATSFQVFFTTLLIFAPSFPGECENYFLLWQTILFIRIFNTFEKFGKSPFRLQYADC